MTTVDQNTSTTGLGLAQSGANGSRCLLYTSDAADE